MAAPTWTGVLCTRPSTVNGALSWYLVANGALRMDDQTDLKVGDGVLLTAAEAAAAGSAVVVWTGPAAAPTTLDVTES